MLAWRAGISDFFLECVTKSYENLELLKEREAQGHTLTVKSTTETSAVETLKAIPVILPLSCGRTLPTALAAPVLAGIMFWPWLSQQYLFLVYYT
jgi:hypothetical protein